MLRDVIRLEVECGGEQADGGESGGELPGRPYRPQQEHVPALHQAQQTQGRVFQMFLSFKWAQHTQKER